MLPAIFSPTSDGAEVLQDIVSASNLVMRQEDHYEFIHKTLVEVYAAKGTASAPEQFRRRFYDAICEDSDRISRWSMELRFLRTIDGLVFADAFAIRALTRVLARCTGSKEEQGEAIFGLLQKIKHGN